VLVRSISLCNFRNYRELQMDFHPCLNIFVGGNAQGKTNILEAIFYAATGKSHRTNFDNELIYWGEKNFVVNLKGNRNKSKIKLDISIRTDGKKILKVNNQIRKKFSELLGIFNAVLFSPEDIMIIKGNPSARRKFLDIKISQTSPIYCNYLVKYNKVLFQRNNLLKAIRENRESQESLDIWDGQLVEYGVRITQKRVEVIQRIIPIAKSIHSKITEGKEEIKLSYVPSIETLNNGHNISSEEIFIKKLKEARNSEIARGITSIGPHRDDIEIRIGAINVKAFGSQGQQKTCALSLKLSEIEFMKQETGDYPVLLLDDVMSELDGQRRKYLLEVVNSNVQTFVTSTGAEAFFEPVKREKRLFEIKSGSISLIQEG
jgi:DNA replication and repair protein RecF